MQLINNEKKQTKIWQSSWMAAPETFGLRWGRNAGQFRTLTSVEDRSLQDFKIDLSKVVWIEADKKNVVTFDATKGE